MTGKGFRYIAAFVLLLGLHVHGLAQGIQDFEIRQELGVIWQPFKKIEINPHYRLNMFDNASRFKRSMFGLGADYNLKKWMSLGGEYRYYMSDIKDYHRFAAYLKLSYRLHKFTFKDRFQYQQDQDYFDREYLTFYAPQRVFRNKLGLNYAYSRKINFYGYADAFVEMKKGELNWYRVRYGLGGNYLYKRQHELGIELFLNDEFQVKAPQNTLTLKLSYDFYVTKAKKKKKKDPSAEETKP